MQFGSPQSTVHSLRPTEPARPGPLAVGAWIDLARTSHYDALELRLHLGLGAERFDGLSGSMFGRPARDWLDFIGFRG
jgi:hypothetical protein